MYALLSDTIFTNGTNFLASEADIFSKNQGWFTITTKKQFIKRAKNIFL